MCLRAPGSVLELCYEQLWQIELVSLISNLLKFYLHVLMVELSLFEKLNPQASSLRLKKQGLNLCGEARDAPDASMNQRYVPLNFVSSDDLEQNVFPDHY